MTYAQLLHRHIYPYIGERRVAEISRETIDRLLTVVLPEAGASRATVINTRACLSAMLQDGTVRQLRAEGRRLREIARHLGRGLRTVQRLDRAATWQELADGRWKGPRPSKLDPSPIDTTGGDDLWICCERGSG